MRIRKQASKLLFLLQQPQSFAFQGHSCESSASPANPSAAAAAASPSSEATVTPSVACARGPPLAPTVCQLNQSPWDVLSPERYCRHRHDYQEMGNDEEESGFFAAATAATDGGTAVGIKGRGGFSSAVVDNRNRTEQPKYEEKVIDEYYNCRKREKQLRLRKKPKATTNIKKINEMPTTAVTTANGKRTRVGVWLATKAGVTDHLEDGEDHNITTSTSIPIIVSTTATTSICKKNDGKGWHCKRAAKHPHSLCNYHLSQIRSYYHVANHVHADRNLSDERKNNANPKKKDKPKVTTPTRTTLKDDDTEFYYYYSAFGPWRGKRRGMLGGEISNKDAVTVSGGFCGNVINVSPSSPASTTPAVNASSLANHDVAEDGGDDELDPESIDDVDDSSCDHVGPVRKKGRKPIKARSLKSLL